MNLLAIAVVDGAAAAYLLAVRRSARRVAVRRQAAGMVGFAALLVAIAGPLDAAAERSLTWHMGQHLLLTSAAAPLLAYGEPWALFLHARRWRRLQARARTALWPAIAVATTALNIGVMALWHLPVAYQRALRDPLVHDVEHASLLASSAVFWWCVLAATRRHRPAAALAVFAAMLAMTMIGAALVLRDAPLYVAPDGSTFSTSDQQLAGVLLWSVSGVVSTAIAIGQFASWVAGSARTYEAIGAGGPVRGRP